MTQRSIEIALAVLEPFMDTSLWEDYADDDDEGFTAEEYDTMLDELRAIAKK